MEFLQKVELIETDSRKVAARGWGVGEMGRGWSKETNFFIRLISSEYLVYSMVTTANNTLLYI